MTDFKLRPARAEEEETIRQTVRDAGLFPFDIIWRRFIVAVDGDERIVGVGQIKPHFDGSFELASIAVLPDWQGKGVGKKVVRKLVRDFKRTHYLFCRIRLVSFYEQFGFEKIESADMPFYFRTADLILNGGFRLFRRPEYLAIMRYVPKK